MDVLDAATQAGVESSAVTRHIAILKRCLGQRDTPVLVARCTSTDPRPTRRLRRRRDMLMLTHRRMVVTEERGLLRRLRLYLNCELRHLGDVTWTPEPALGGIRLAATAVDGVREHFWVDAGTAERVRRLDGVLRQVFAA